jgi:hypothetical protein
MSVIYVFQQKQQIFTFSEIESLTLLKHDINWSHLGSIRNLLYKC